MIASSGLLSLSADAGCYASITLGLDLCPDSMQGMVGADLISISHFHNIQRVLMGIRVD